MDIKGKAKISMEDARKFAESKNATKIFIFNASIYWRLCEKIGINPEIAYMQYALETGFGKFGGVLDDSFCNPCGLKNPAGGGDYDAKAHKKFKTWTDGIQAHIDHLALYAGVSGYPKIKTQDPRHFKYLFNVAPTVEQLNGRWATSANYDKKIINLITEMRNYAKKTN